jgi:hypothetical protein
VRSTETISSFRVSNETIMTKPSRRVPVFYVLTFLAASACSQDAGPPAPAHVEATSGEGQIAPVLTLLPEPVVATVLDASGAPLAGVAVDWAVAGDGRIMPVSPTTDAQGHARAFWMLGGTVGPSQASAHVPELTPATFSATAESSDQLPFDDVRMMDIPTYDGSGQVVHPDYVRTPDGVFTAPHHLAITPYPFNEPALENPSHFIGTRRDEWSLEAGAPNPVARPAIGYLSDPDMLYVPESRELWLYYRHVPGDNFILMTRSTDGLRWTDPVQVVHRPAHEVVSQSVVRRGPGDWWMYSVNAGERGCGGPSTTIEVRRSMDGVSWTDPEPLGLATKDLFAWHLEVQWIPSRNEFWALYNVKRNGGCATPALFMATSPDGYTWTELPAPVLARGRIPELTDIVYRSTLDYDPASDAITFWYSGAAYNGKAYVWRAAVERRRRAEVFGAPQTASLRRDDLLRPAPAELGEEWP